MTQNQIDVMYGVIYILGLDTVLGIWVALKYKKFSSHNLARVFSKVGTYGLALGTAWIVSAVEPEHMGLLFRLTGIFIITTEAFSNFEKLALLDFKFPLFMLSKVNKEFKEFRDMEKNLKKIHAEKIIDKRIDKC